MARKKGSDAKDPGKTPETETDNDIPDAEIVETDDTAERDAEPADAAGGTEDTITSDEGTPETEWARAAESDADLAEGDSVPDAGDNQLSAETEHPAAPPPPSPEQRSGMLPMVFGGAIAAALGFGAAFLVFGSQPPEAPATDPAVTAAIDDQAARLSAIEDSISGLTAQISDLTARPDPDERIDAVRDELLTAVSDATDDGGAAAALEAQLGDLAARIEALANQPAAEIDIPTDQMDALRAEIDATVAAARQDLETARAEAAAIEAAAEDAARIAAAEAALARIDAALESGSGYADALATVAETGTGIPEALSASATSGVPTLPVLQAEFAEAARAALDASIRAEASGGTVDRALAFLRTQTGARSLSPREGDDPDAVLSRAEAALRAGDLGQSLAELDTLPEAGAMAMTGWVAEAERRHAALTALAELRGAIESGDG